MCVWGPYFALAKLLLMPRALAAVPAPLATPHAQQHVCEAHKDTGVGTAIPTTHAALGRSRPRSPGIPHRLSPQINCMQSTSWRASLVFLVGVLKLNWLRKMIWYVLIESLGTSILLLGRWDAGELSNFYGGRMKEFSIRMRIARGGSATRWPQS